MNHSTILHHHILTLLLQVLTLTLIIITTVIIITTKIIIITMTIRVIAPPILAERGQPPSIIIQIAFYINHFPCFHSRAVQIVGPFVIMIYRMIAKDLLRFLIWKKKKLET